MKSILLVLSALSIGVAGQALANSPAPATQPNAKPAVILPAEGQAQKADATKAPEAKKDEKAAKKDLKKAEPAKADVKGEQPAAK